jgi:anti-anti-sigma factor
MTSLLSMTDVDVDTDDRQFTAQVNIEGDQRTVHVTGELDLASRGRMVRSCVEGVPNFVVVELAGLTFMDCGGYRAFVEVRTFLKQRGRSLVLANPRGEPARLLALIDGWAA